MGDTPVGIVSAVCAVLYTVIAGKGKISCYLFGIVNTVLYGKISLDQKLFGEVMINWFYYLPMMFFGIAMWKKHRSSEQIIRKTALTFRERTFYFPLAAVSVVLYGLLLNGMGGRTPMLDSATTILSIFAMIFTVKRCIEQWVLWTVVNLISICMWLKIFFESGNSAASLLMWCMALVNGIIFFRQWKKDVEMAGKGGSVCPENAL